MPSLSSLSRMVSALSSNQAGLNTTAHNLANVETKGYSRQRVELADSKYLTLGRSSTSIFSVGLGVDVTAVRQIRDSFLDANYRKQASIKGFYDSKAATVREIETILGEIEGESFTGALNDLFGSINELTKHPDGLETRGVFIQSAVKFVNRANLIMEQLTSYQENLNKQVIDSVDEINSIGEQIVALNNVIVKNEQGGGNANDYRDERNNLLDRLAVLAKIDYKENAAGYVKVRLEDTEFININGYNEIELEEAEPLSPLVSPVWSHLSASPTQKLKVFNFNGPVNNVNENDRGELKAQLLCRGTRKANWMDMDDTLGTTVYSDDIKPSVVMNTQAQFDNLIHNIVTMINDVVSPNTDPAAPPSVLDSANAPYSLDGQQGIEIFKRKLMDRYDGVGTYNAEDITNEYSLYSADNIEVNPEVLVNFDRLCFSTNVNDVGDTSVVKQIVDNWIDVRPGFSIDPDLKLELNYTDYYIDFIGAIGNEGNSADNKAKNQDLLLIQIDNERDTIKAVSSDEELGNIIKYQHAYNAAAKVVTVVDEMIDQIVSRTGVVGR